MISTRLDAAFFHTLQVQGGDDEPPDESSKCKSLGMKVTFFRACRCQCGESDLNRQNCGKVAFESDLEQWSKGYSVLRYQEGYLLAFNWKFRIPGLPVFCLDNRSLMQQNIAGCCYDFDTNGELSLGS